MNPNKPGYKTTEFWTVILAYLFSGLVAKGLIDAESARVLTSGFADLLVALVPFIAVLVNLYYIKSRKEIKKASLLISAGENIKIVDLKKQPGYVGPVATPPQMGATGTVSASLPPAGTSDI